MRKIVKILKWTFAGIIGLAVVVAISGSIYQRIAESRDMERFPPPGELIEVNGAKMHIHCQGEGSPTVVVEQGAGAPAMAWQDVNARIAQTTRVCAYDRPGLGYSEPIDKPMTTDLVVDNLQKLLNKAGIDDDLVLVGWSIGGVYIREYYARHPDGVSGMVLVDSSHEQQMSRMPSSPMEEQMTPATVLQYLAPLGLIRISGLVENQINQTYPDAKEEYRKRLAAIYNQSHTFGSALMAAKGREADFSANREPRSLGDLPLTVLSQGKEPEVPPGAPPELTLEWLQEQRPIWNELQKELTALSSSGQRIVAKESGHSIHADQPDLLVQSVTDMVELVRDEY